MAFKVEFKYAGSDFRRVVYDLEHVPNVGDEVEFRDEEKGVAYIATVEKKVHRYVSLKSSNEANITIWISRPQEGKITE